MNVFPATAYKKLDVLHSEYTMQSLLQPIAAVIGCTTRITGIVHINIHDIFDVASQPISGAVAAKTTTVIGRSGYHAVHSLCGYSYLVWTFVFVLFVATRKQMQHFTILVTMHQENLALSGIQFNLLVLFD